MSISGGIDHFCGIAADGTAYCWGRNGFGQLGDGTTVDRQQPTRVLANVKFIAIEPAARATYAIDPQGRAYSWGSSLNGALGDGRNSFEARSLVPTPMPTPVRFRELGKGCALGADSLAYCWGTVKPALLITDEHLEPGDCTAEYYFYYSGSDCLVPTRVKGALRFASIGGCGLTDAGAAYCWGSGYFGELGDGRSGPLVHSIAPVAVAGGIRFAQLSGGCGLDIEGRAYCWGNNAMGQLGIGETGGLRSVPTQVLTDTRFVAIVSNGGNTCALTRQGAVWCWGSNDSGQLGPTFTGARSNVPVLVTLPDL